MIWRKVGGHIEASDVDQTIRGMQINYMYIYICSVQSVFFQVNMSHMF